MPKAWFTEIKNDSSPSGDAVGKCLYITNYWANFLYAKCESAGRPKGLIKHRCEISQSLIAKDL